MLRGILLSILGCAWLISQTPAAQGQDQPILNLVEQAAAALAAGREQEAANLLQRHVAENPAEIIVQAQLAELLFRLNNFTQSRWHFERFLAAAQDQPDVAFRYVIHGHSRLVEIGGKLGLEYDEHLHRGIGLYLLANRRAMEPSPNSVSHTELLQRAANELRAARGLLPSEARAHFYLACVWEQMGQRPAALAALRRADERAAGSVLSDGERRRLHMQRLANIPW